jgi:hypothetical protein
MCKALGLIPTAAKKANKQEIITSNKQKLPFCVPRHNLLHGKNGPSP